MSSDDQSPESPLDHDEEILEYEGRLRARGAEVDLRRLPSALRLGYVEELSRVFGELSGVDLSCVVFRQTVEDEETYWVNVTPARVVVKVGEHDFQHIRHPAVPDIAAFELIEESENESIEVQIAVDRFAREAGRYVGAKRAVGVAMMRSARWERGLDYIAKGARTAFVRNGLDLESVIGLEQKVLDAAGLPDSMVTSSDNDICWAEVSQIAIAAQRTKQVSESPVAEAVWQRLVDVFGPSVVKSRARTQRLGKVVDNDLTGIKPVALPNGRVASRCRIPMVNSTVEASDRVFIQCEKGRFAVHNLAIFDLDLLERGLPAFRGPSYWNPGVGVGRPIVLMDRNGQVETRHGLVKEFVRMTPELALAFQFIGLDTLGETSDLPSKCEKTILEYLIKKEGAEVSDRDGEIFISGTPSNFTSIYKYRPAAGIQLAIETKEGVFVVPPGCEEKYELPDGQSEVRSARSDLLAVFFLGGRPDFKIVDDNSADTLTATRISFIERPPLSPLQMTKLSQLSVRTAAAQELDLG